MRNFTNLADLTRYATQVMDPELLGKIRIVKTCHHNLPSLIDKIRRKAIGDIATAGLLLVGVKYVSERLPKLCLRFLSLLCTSRTLLFILFAPLFTQEYENSLSDY